MHFPFPQTLDAGESVSFRMHIGFIPSKQVEKKLREIHTKYGPVNYHTAFIALAKMGLTLYGGKASYKKHTGVMVSFDPSSYKNDPIYRVAFISGRGNEFVIITSESASRWQRANQTVRK